MKESKVLFTGGSGLLGTTVKKIRPDWQYPTHEQLDINNLKGLELFCCEHQIEMIVHAAAFTGVPKCEENPQKAIYNNIAGTATLAIICLQHDIRLVYVSTDYVYKSSIMKEGRDESYNIRPGSRYAWSKLGGECSANMVKDSMIIRTTFGPDVFPYDKAYEDQWTSRENVSVIADKIVCAAESGICGTMNIGGSRKTVFKYAVETAPFGKKIEPILRQESAYVPPEDTSLDTAMYDALIGGME